ncbi:MAG: UDP-N-acetylglucosamine pyrophosphorylase [Clostridia bacterium]|nr:UDP-N-acetylglucosamine pyrophosphorylase [Clostridia bacterium]
MTELFTTSLLDLSHTDAKPLLQGVQYPWQALAGIGDFIADFGKTLGEEYFHPRETVWIHKTAKVAPTAFLGERVIIGADAEIRHCAFIRGNAQIGKGAVVGNSTELKNVILFDGVQVPHYNYVGDSILGYKAHMGAGAITSNVKADHSLVAVRGKETIPTHLKKFGAILGDFAEIGCSAVLNPGTVIGRRSNVYPLSMVRGVIAENSIYKNKNEIIKKEP